MKSRLIWAFLLLALPLSIKTSVAAESDIEKRLIRIEEKIDELLKAPQPETGPIAKVCYCQDGVLNAEAISSADVALYRNLVGTFESHAECLKAAGTYPMCQ